METAEKKIVDLEKLTPRELLEELVNRLVVYEESGTRLSKWVGRHNYNPDEEFIDGYEDLNEEYDDLKTDHDEDWCRVREIVRFVKGDDTLWTC